jgi:parallel beta-helix repeat protein
MLSSLSYVTASSSLQDYINAILQADRDIPEYSSEHIQEITNIFNDRGFFDDEKVSGAISSNTTWENCKWITGNVTVNSGVALTISPGTYLFFDDDTRLTVNGTLIAQGSSDNPIVFTSSNETPSSGDWYGIRFEDSSVDASCIIDYCDIRNADFGVYCYYSKPKIQNSNFEDNTRALYLFNADNIVIKGCQLIDNSYGIYSGYTDNISIKNNIIQDCYYYGVYLYRSSATIMENSIENTSYYDGINVASYSDIDMNHVYAHPNIEINNSIIDNHRYGIYIASSASADLGVKLYMQPPYLRGGFNFFEHDSGIYDAYNASSNTVRAELNWWDNMALSGSFDTYPTAIDQGYQLPKSTSDEVHQLIAEAYRLEIVDSAYADAINLLNRAIAVDPSDPVNYKILLSLVRLYNKMDDADGLLHYLDQLFYEYSDKLIGKIALDYSVSVFLSRRNFKEALKRSDQAISIWSLEKGGNELMAWALYEQGQIIQEIEKQSGDLAKSTGKSSVDIFAMILENYPESEAAEAIGLMDIEIEPEAEKTAVIPRKFALKSAYPNPFNPKTTISFDLPEEARVEIVVYDLIGREIWQSTRTSYPAGTHSLVWNGTTKSGQPVGTGVYLVRLNSPKYSATQKVLLIK